MEKEVVCDDPRVALGADRRQMLVDGHYLTVPQGCRKDQGMFRSSELIRDDLAEAIKKRVQNVATTLLQMGTLADGSPLWKQVPMLKLAEHGSIDVFLDLGLQLKLARHPGVSCSISLDENREMFINNRVSFERELEILDEIPELIVLHKHGIMYLKREFQALVDFLVGAEKDETLYCPQKVQARETWLKNRRYIRDTVPKNLQEFLEGLGLREVKTSVCEDLRESDKRKARQLEKLNVINIRRESGVWHITAGSELRDHYNAKNS